LGDDLLARLNQRLDLKAWVLRVAQFKMVLKAKAPTFEHNATFLSRRIILGGTAPCMLPLVGKMIARFNARGTMNPSVGDNDYMAGKALSYAYECRHVPFMRDRFLARYLTHENARPVFDELSWFTRTSGMDNLGDIMSAIKNENVLVDDDTFDVWLLNTYDLDLYELSTIMDATINNTDRVVVDLPWFHKMFIDL